jgi:hypothetical protein
MPQTPKIRHPYPDENRRDWFEQFEAFANSLDASDFASRDDRNIAVVLTGVLSFVSAGSGVGNVVWDAPIDFYHGTSGYRGSVPSNITPGINLEDGDAVYVNVARGPTGPYVLTTVKTVAALPANEQAVLLFCRLGDFLWVRHNGIVRLGGSIGNVSGLVITSVPLITKQTHGEGLITMGRVRVNYSDWSLPGGATLNLRIEAQNTDDDFNSDIRFYDVDPLLGDTLLASFDIDLDDQPQQLEAIIVPVDTTTDRVYELRAGLQQAGPGSPYDISDEIIVWYAALEIIHA